MNPDIRHSSRPGLNVSCQAIDDGLDIEYVHPPKEGKLESENLRESVRKQVIIYLCVLGHANAAHKSFG